MLSIDRNWVVVDLVDDLDHLHMITLIVQHLLLGALINFIKSKTENKNVLDLGTTACWCDLLFVDWCPGQQGPNYL